jgi:hypothetical protein
MRIRKRVVVFASATILTLGGGLALVAAAAAPAFASGQSEVCDVYNAGGGNYEPFYCINAWNGGPYEAAYQWSSATNNYWYAQGVDRCGNGDYTTANCPISGINAGYFVYQLRYGNASNTCMGTVTAGGEHNAQGIFTGCNETGYPGTGGGDGTIEIAIPGSCPSGTNVALNAYWYGQDGNNIATLSWGDSNGSEVYMNNEGTAVCLGQYNY